MDDDDGKSSYLIAVAHGTYGHNDDAYGALLVANGILARRWKASILLREDGVYMALRGQDPTDVGLENSLKHISDFTELGGRMVAVSESLEARGIGPEEMVDGVNVIRTEDLADIVEEHDFCLTF